jgi:NAD-dependent dihydropyrimidine dehydrogenase PreA subunit
MPTVAIEEAGCRNCGLCVAICPTKVFEEDGPQQLAKVVRQEDCIGCTSCLYLCPSRCLSVTAEKPQRPFHRMESNAALVSRFLQQVPATQQLGQADYDEALKDTYVRLLALSDALKEIMGRGQRAVGRSAGNLAAAHLPEIYETTELAQLLAAMSRRFAHAFEFAAQVEPDAQSATLTFPACAMHKVVAAQGAPAGSANLCELFHEYFAGLLSAFSGKSYTAATVSTVGQCTVKFQIRS